MAFNPTPIARPNAIAERQSLPCSSFTQASSAADQHASSGTSVEISAAEKETPDGAVYKSLVAEGVGKVAESLDEFRGRWKYNMLDEHAKRYNLQDQDWRKQKPWYKPSN